MAPNTYVSIGNSDDRLSQAQWSRFVREMRALLEQWQQQGALQIHGEWFAAPDQPWQNANWCVEIQEPAWCARVDSAGRRSAHHQLHRLRDMEKARSSLREQVKALCLRYSQDSFAWATAEVQLVETGWPETVVERPIAESPWVKQARAEGWTEGLTQQEPFRPTPTAQMLMDQAEMAAADARRLPFPPDRANPLIPGAAGDSTPLAPASTGDGEPWARTEGELRGHDHIPGVACPVVDCHEWNSYRFVPKGQEPNA